MYGDETKAKVARSLTQGQQGQPMQAEANGCSESYGGGGPVRQSSLRMRIEQTLAAGDRQMRRLEAAHRAKQIIDQHPEFAELLDLLNEF